MSLFLVFEVEQNEHRFLTASMLEKIIGNDVVWVLSTYYATKKKILFKMTLKTFMIYLCINQQLTFTPLCNYFRYRKSNHYSTKIRQMKYQIGKQNFDNLSNLEGYANFLVKRLREDHVKMT